MKRFALVATLAALTLTGCQKGNKATVIPDNASMVISVDLISMADETDLMESSVYGLICRFLQIDPMEMGLDYMDPLMVFSMPDGTLGLTLSIDNEETLTDCLTEYARKNIATLPKQSGELMWSELLGEVQLAYDGNTLLAIIISDKSNSNVKKIMTDLFKMEYEDSFYSTKDYEKMEEMSGKDILMYANLSVMPEKMKDFYSMLMPKGIKSSNVELMSYFDSGDGILVMNSELYSDDEHTQELLNNYEGAMKPITGDYIQQVPKESSMTVMAGVNGEQFYQLIKQLPSLSQQLSIAEVASGIDLGNKIKSADGDIMFCMGYEDPLCLTINKETLPLAKGWEPNIMEKLPVSADELSQYSMYAYMDCEKNYSSDMSKTIPIPSVYRCVNDIKAITVKSKGKGDWTITILSNNDENFLKQLLQ